MAITVGQLIRNNAVDKDFNPLPSIDSAYGPYSSIQDANSKTHVQDRSLGLTVGIIQNGLIEEYWYKTGVEDINLVKKTLSRVSDLDNDINYITKENADLLYNPKINIAATTDVEEIINNIPLELSRINEY